MIIRTRFENTNDTVLRSRSENWSLFVVADSCSLRNIVDGVLTGTLSPKVDLTWADVAACKYFVAVTGKDLPETNEFSEASGEVRTQDLYERNRRIFLRCVMPPARGSIPEEQNQSTEINEVSANQSSIIDLTTAPTTKNTIVDILMKKRNHYPTEKQNPRQLKNIDQYNAIVKYIKKSGFGVTGSCLQDYERFVDLFSKLLWELDPHYYKFQFRGKTFDKVIENNFLHFNNPKAHGHKVKNYDSNAITLKVNELKIYLDRGFMNSSHMNRLQKLILSVIDQTSSYLDILEKQRERTLLNSNRTELPEVSIEEFATTNIKMKTRVQLNNLPQYEALQKLLVECDIYDPVNINSIRDSSSHRLRTDHYRFMKNILENGLPFVIPGVKVFHFKLPSQGPHQAVHFFWKQPEEEEVSDTPSQLKLISELRENRDKYYTRSMKKEIQSKFLKLGIVKPHEAVYAIKDILGDKSASTNENQKEVLERMRICMSVDEEVIVDLRKNNGSKVMYDGFWDVVSNHIEELTAVDDRRHNTIVQNENGEDEVVVNMAMALSYADLYRECVKKAAEKGIASPTYSWFLMQFWPSNKTTSKLLHYTGRFKVKRVIQSRLLRKPNADVKYARTVYKFLKKRAINNRLNCVFLSADAKCKVSIGEPGYPLAAVSRGKKVIVGKNQTFKVGDHDFSKLSVIPDAVLVHQIPSFNLSDAPDIDESDQVVEGTKSNGSWYAGNVYYTFKNMALEGSTAIREVVEMGRVLETEYVDRDIPERFYLITDGGGDRNITNISVIKPLVALFRKYDFDELIAIRTAAGLSFYNPVERHHARANLGLQAVGMMRSKMNDDLERILKKCNSNKEIRKACSTNVSLSEGIKTSLEQPVNLLKEVFGKLSLINNEFRLFEPAEELEIQDFEKEYDVFDYKLSDLKQKLNLNKFPIFAKFLKEHSSSRTYSFRVFKCSDSNCVFHKPLRGDEPDQFPDPVPNDDENAEGHYKEGYDPNEQHLPSKMEDVSKLPHNIPFRYSSITSKNVGLVMKCSECGKPRLIHSKNKMKKDALEQFKRVINDYVYVCGGSFSDVDIDEGNNDTKILSTVFIRENLDCQSLVELPYYSAGIFENVCIYCGSSKDVVRNELVYPKCQHCSTKDDIKKTKRKTVLAHDLNKRHKTS